MARFIRRMNEKIGGVEGTKLDDDFVEMERQTEIMSDLVEDIHLKTNEFLHPNPASRAMMSAVKGISKMLGKSKAQTYTQPEGVLGEAMLTHGNKLGDESMYGQSLVEVGESMRQMADSKYNLDDNMKMNFLEPLHDLSTKDIKEVMSHCKKLQGYRLDYDSKKSKKEKGSTVGDNEIKLAEDKFAESLRLAQLGMHNLLDNDVEAIAQLAMFAENLVEHHRQCTEIMEGLVNTLNDKKNEAAARPKREFVLMTLSDPGVLDSPHDGMLSNSNTNTIAASPLPSPMMSPAKSPMLNHPSCSALYDFKPENPGELAFNKGDVITLIQWREDEWFEGTINGKTGLLPVAYVEVINPLP